MAAKEATPSIEDFLKEIAKKYDMRVGPASEVVEETQWLTTDSIGIDYVSGAGMPVGRSVELYGPPSSGKTTAALQTAAALQRQIIAEGRDEHILYLDFEHAIDPEYTANLGLDIEHSSFLLAQPYSMEQGAEAALKLIATGKVRLSIWDSVAAMASIARLEGEFDQRTAAMNKARLMAGLMLQLTPLLYKNKSTAMLINHLMESVEMTGRPGMPPKVTTPGGKAKAYYASVRLEFRQMGNAKAKTPDVLTGEVTNQSIATYVKVKCVKNKVASPFREAELRIRYGRGFDNVWSALQVALAYKAVRKDGAWYRFLDTSLHHPEMRLSVTGKTGHPSIQGETSVLAFADEHPEWGAQLIKMATALIETHGGAALRVEVGDDQDDSSVSLVGDSDALFGDD